MSTNSRIAIQKKDGTIKSIYCHWDGYPNGVGKTLLEHYKGVRKVNSLIALGSISSLEKNIKPTLTSHSFDHKESNCTVAYHRDRGEELQIDEYNKQWEWTLYDNCEEWNYLWKDGAWYFKGCKGKSINKLTLLTKEHINNKNLY